MSTNTQFRVLVCGAGVAGPVFAYCLSRMCKGASDLSITIVERSPSARTTGQAVDIRGPAVKVLRHMGLEAEVKRHHTNEKGTCLQRVLLVLLSHTSAGFEVIDSNGKAIAVFGASGDESRQSFSSEFEILRGQLARVFVDAAVQRPGVTVIYGEYISSISQPADGGAARVEFTNGKLPAADYDLVVGADGFMSHTRALMTGRSAKAHVHDMGGSYMAYFTIKSTPSDSPTNARAYTAPGPRSIMIRPSPAGRGVLLGVKRPGDPELEAVAAQGVDAQKQYFARYYAGTGWETPRVLEGMMAADDFYFQHIGQIKCERWSSGRVVLLGDAGYCPSVMTGMGTSLALYGGWILAGEISQALRDGTKLSDACDRYERTARPYVERVHKIPPGSDLFAPKTRLGIWVLHMVVRICYWLGLAKLFGSLIINDEHEKEPLPMYEWADE
jgi:2-polyprenyl-6-methoxyphenol hydroxylase-like FAD-dependent oxidoreductase